MRHKLAHLLRLNRCHSAAYWKGGVLMRAYACDVCDRVKTVGPAPGHAVDIRSRLQK